MDIVVSPGTLSGALTPPQSKSHAQRMLVLARLSGTAIEPECPCVDVLATMSCLEALHGGAALDCAESAATLRLLMPVCAALGSEVTFTGRGRLPRRPIADLLRCLAQNGARIDGDQLPIRVSGRLKPGVFELPGDVSSQFVSGLLLALPLLAGNSRITLTSPLESAGYVDMTIRAMRDFSARVEPIDHGYFVPGGQIYRAPARIGIERDWSAAAPFFAMNALGSQVELLSLDAASAQPDRAMPRLMGARNVDLSPCPDLAPSLAAVAALRPGTTVLSGTRRLRLKESDRAQAIASMLRALGIGVLVEENRLVVTGGRPTGGALSPMGDHRIAMAACALATRASGPVTILGADCVAKSYPGFFEDFIRLGGKTNAALDG